MKTITLYWIETGFDNLPNYWSLTETVPFGQSTLTKKFQLPEHLSDLTYNEYAPSGNVTLCNENKFYGLETIDNKPVVDNHVLAEYKEQENAYHLAVVKRVNGEPTDTDIISLGGIDRDKAFYNFLGTLCIEAHTFRTLMRLAGFTLSYEIDFGKLPFKADWDCERELARTGPNAEGISLALYFIPTAA